jgi:hypothetical protein
LVILPGKARKVTGETQNLLPSGVLVRFRPGAP